MAGGTGKEGNSSSNTTDIAVSQSVAMETPRLSLLVLLLTCLDNLSAQNFHFSRERERQDRSCRSPGGVRGECVLITRCPALLDLLRAAPRPPGAVDFLRRSWCGSEGRYPRVCCVRGFAYTPPSSTPATAGSGTTPARNTVTAPPGGAFQGHKNANLLPLADCGADFSERIFGGSQVEITEYPWLALIRYRTRDGRLLFLCGGSLINKRYVLTASHCINGKELTDYRLVGVRLGEYNTDTDKDCVEELTGDMTCADPPQDYGVEAMIPHPEYGPLSSNQFNDIGLLRLDRDAPDRSDFIKPICLPMGGEVQSRAYVGQNLTVAGWGKTESSSASNVKLKVSVPVVSQEDCYSVYQGKREVSYSTQMCAGGKAGQDSCTGDSGGPLMAVETLRGSNRNHIAGVVSYGPRVCGTEGWPGVYTRVASYVPWILDNLKP